MDRDEWLKQMRLACEEEYDIRWAPFYGEKWGLYDNSIHLQFLQEFLRLLPHNSHILDAACGAGRYLPVLLAGGHSVIGIDQSGGMLSKAREKFPSVQFEKVGLQEMDFQAAFDGIICMDAMENVPPEDWGLVLGHFHRALRQSGCLYFTVESIEKADENEVRQAFEKGRADGLPIIYGECPDEGTYHFHPSASQVREWVGLAGFELLKEADAGIWYYHVLARKGQG